MSIGQHLANLRRKGGLGKDPKRAAERAAQLSAIDEDWNCSWSRSSRRGRAPESRAGDVQDDEAGLAVVRAPPRRV